VLRVLRAVRGLLVTAALLAGALVSAGCSSPATTVSAGYSDLARVKVTGGVGAVPALTAPLPFSVTTTTASVLVRGTGPIAAAGQRVTIDYSAFNGVDGKQFDTTFGGRGHSRVMLLDPSEWLAGVVKGIVGRPVGSRLLIAIPPQDAFGTAGQAAAGIGPTDTILVVVDVTSAHAVLSRSTGTPVTPRAGLPTVRLAKDGRPTISLPATNAPAELLAQPLITGTGPKIAKGQTVTVHYVGVVWPGGRQFDSSWARGRPWHFQLGAGTVIAGWDEGLAGQTVGSQVLLVVPPDKGYGAAGSAGAKISGTDTLVFVVDILDAA